jgi:hypothetical protein
MSLVVDDFAQVIDQQLVLAGAIGTNKLKFCKAVSTGLINSLKGKSFTTLDTGTVPGVGQGTGTGLIGLMPDQMTQIGIAAAPGMTGDNALPLMTAIMTASQQYLAMAAALASNDTPVFLGTGTIVIGSIMVTMDEVNNNLQSAFKDQKANGDNMPALCKAIATGFTFGILTMATGELVIVGTPTGTPAPGGGPGMGTIS